MQGVSVKQTRSVCSERARAAAADRSRCGFAKQIRGFSAQCPNPKEMCCRWHFCQLCPRTNGSPPPAENRTLCRARALGKRRGSAGWDTLSQRSSNGKCVPDYRLRMGCIFRMDCWRKVHPGIAPQNGTCFPPAASSTPKPMRPPFQNWVEEIQNAIAGGQYDCRR